MKPTNAMPKTFYPQLSTHRADAVTLVPDYRFEYAPFPLPSCEDAGGRGTRDMDEGL